MNLNSIKFISLCYIFSSFINIGVSIFARIYTRHKEFNLLIAYWLYFSFVFVYSFLFHESLLEIASSFFLQFVGINLLVQIVGQKNKWFEPLVYQIPAFILSTYLLLKTDLGFSYSLIPSAIVLGVPFLKEAYRTLYQNRNKTNWAEKAMAVLFVFFALHNVDFLIFRLDPEAQLWCYSVSLVLIQCVSLFVPMAISLRREELERHNITSALNTISDVSQNPALEIDELYKNLTLQISQKEAFLRELKESNSVLTEEKLVNEILIRTITHDLSGPLSNISNYCEILHSGKIEVLEENKIWNRIHFYTQAAITKINNTKTALKTRSMAEDILTQEISLNKSLQTLLFKHDAALKNKDLTCEFSCPGGVSILASEPALNEHVLSHLLSNAIKYSNRGQKIKISVECKNDDSTTIEIRDFGIGLPTSAYERRILSSLPGTEGETGYGFGLMISGYFMRRFGGSFSFETPTDGPGTRVILKFRKIAATNGVTPKPVSTLSNT